ncbi:MAG: hypothetical protein JWQ82_1752 [Tardiphaga sp.]|nr:hypothetical protein [Tardiphaga sp.]
MSHLYRMAGLAAAAMLIAASSANGADLAGQSRLGAIFSEPPARVVRVVPAEEPRPQGILYTNALKVPGYYGTPRDFEYRNYYGTSPIEIYSRLPYACGFVGLC